jgi:hypothetical protein
MRYLLALFALVLGGCASRGPYLQPVLDQTASPAQLELPDVPFFPQEDYQCGPASLATVLSHSGLNVSPNELVPRVYLPAKEGSLQVEMVAAVRRYDRIPYVLEPSFPALLAELQAGRPVVVFQNLGLSRLPVWHFAVVVGYSAKEDRLILRSGRSERLRSSAFNFLRTWKQAGQWALVILRPGELPVADDVQGTLRSLAAKESVSGAASVHSSYRAAAERWPDDATARFAFANSLRANGQLDDAIDEYRRLLQRHPDNIPALNNFADAMGSRGCFLEGLEAIDRALTLASADDALRPVLEQTRKELAGAQKKGQVHSATCAQ